MLYVDATCINYDGNAFDAALVAMIAALRNSEQLASIPFYTPNVILISARLPKASFDEETGRTTCSRKELKKSLDINRTPISTSFGIFDAYALFLNVMIRFC